MKNESDNYNLIRIIKIEVEVKSIKLPVCIGVKLLGIDPLCQTFHFLIRAHILHVLFVDSQTFSAV